MTKFHGYLRNHPLAVDVNEMEDEFHYRDESIFLGYNQVTMDAPPEGKIFEKERVVIVFDGAIYNVKELRAKLEDSGYSFSTTLETEVVSHVYGSKGKNARSITWYVQLIDLG